MSLVVIVIKIFQYVRVVGQMYKKVWDNKHQTRRKRFMMDPDFGVLTNTLGR